MKKIRFLIVILLCILMIPITINADTKYEDQLGPKLNNNSEQITLYLFYLKTCPHCAEEKKFLNKISEKYPDLNIIYYECTYDTKEYDIATSHFGIAARGFPFTVLGDQYYFGFNDSVKSNIENQLKMYFGESQDDDKKFEKQYDLPIIGKVDAKKVSIPLVTVALGAVDGFNPCAMWILLFILSILINQKDRKKMIIIGSVFLFISGFVYYLAILGINLFLDIINVKSLQVVLGIVAIAVGAYNLYNFFKTIKDTGCTVVNDTRRKSLIKRFNRVLEASGFISMILGVIALAISVNALELMCSLGFPTIFSEILSINNIHGLMRYIYILLYTIIYMADDLIVFFIAVFTMKLVGTSNRVGKVVKLISALLMVAIGVLLIWFPKIIMLNF